MENETTTGHRTGARPRPHCRGHWAGALAEPRVHSRRALEALQNPGDSNDWVTPDPIPNSEVKPVSADGTPFGGE